MTTSTTSRFLSVNEASRRLGIRLDSTYRLLQGGWLAATKNEYGVWLVPEEAVEARIERHARIAAGRKKDAA